MKDFIRITDFSTEELTQILSRADRLQTCWHNNTMPQTLQKQRIALWFWGNGFRNRMSFEIGARAMGADVSFVAGDLGVHEPIQDIGHYLRNWFSMIVIRARSHEDLVSVSGDALVPVINARTNYSHPCEIIGDLQYIKKVRGSIDNLTVVFVGEVTNLCMSWFEAAVRFPIDVVQLAPTEYLFPTEKVLAFNSNAVGRISTSSDLNNAISKNTELIYTDCWPKEKDFEQVQKLFIPYQITRNVLDKMNDKGIFLPCPPVTRGQEVSEEAMHSQKCQDYAAKEYLLHAQNSIMEFCIRE